ncbi:MAG TPA: sterol desaturase family protein [Aquihabitans sp.]|nr:sterol desaturase family protein [Aquihabitans sp.]
MDLTLIAIPAYFGGMGAEHAWLKRTAPERGRTPGDYEREDTIASLAMGVGSLLVPLALQRLLAPVTPGKGRYAKVLMGAALAAGAVTTVADVLARKGEGPLGPAGVVPPTSLADATAALDGTGADDTGPDGVDPAGGPARATTGPRAERRRLATAAQKVASSAGATALVAGGVSVATGWANRTAARKLFARRPGRDLGNGPLAVAGAVLAWDFVYYWNHRLAHESRYVWAVHVVHHSSEHYNLSTALRQPVADTFTATLPYGALALLGFRPDVIETARGVNLLYQFWIHTEAIRSIGKAERVLNSPSLHRVHHGSNRKYLDRNHGSILIIWDRLFATHQVEEEEVVYGLTRNIETHHPVRIATHEYADIIRDVRSATTWRDRLSYVFRGPGWAYERRARDAVAVEALPVDLPEPVAAGVS